MTILVFGPSPSIDKQKALAEEPTEEVLQAYAESSITAQAKTSIATAERILSREPIKEGVVTTQEYLLQENIIHDDKHSNPSTITLVYQEDTFSKRIPKDTF